MVPIDLVQIPSLTLLFLDEHVQIELQKFRDQASLFYNYFADLIMKSVWETKDTSSWNWVGEKQKPLEKDAGEKTIAWLDKIRNSNGSIPTSKIRLNMQRIMQNNAAVFRTQETLEEGTFLQVVVFSFFIFIFIFLLLFFF